jgi:hypothetical protein
MSVSRKRSGACALAVAALAWGGEANAEVKIAEADGWVLSTDGRVNAFVSYVWGDNRPKGLESLAWVGFNESGDTGQSNADGKLSKTRVRSGYVPSTLAINLKKQLTDGLKLTGRVEVGFQIANVDPTWIGDPTWMEPRAVYLDVGGFWGRGNLLMNYELGHAYGVGFPCAYEKVFGGACGHVGFGTLWPDFRAQVTYSTPDFGDAFQISVGVFDPRTVPTYSWTQTALPRFEGEAVFHYNWHKDWGVKAFANGAWQQLGIGVDQTDPVTFEKTGRIDYKQDAYGAGGGLVGYLGPVKAGASGFLGKGMDGFEFLTFNPILVGQADGLKSEERRFRPVKGILAELSVTFGGTSIMGGFGQTFLSRIATDKPIDEVNAFPLIRTQRGISAGVFQRIDNIVIGLDYFNANYGFDPNVVQDGTEAPRAVQVSQNVNVLNGGVTLEW